MNTTHVLAEHQHTVLHEPSDTFVTIHARSVDQPRIGPSVWLDDWSMSADDARLLAASLTMLADATEEIRSPPNRPSRSSSPPAGRSSTTCSPNSPTGSQTSLPSSPHARRRDVGATSGVTGSSLPPGDDALIRRIQDLERVVREQGPGLMAAITPAINNITTQQATLTTAVANINTLLGNEVAPGVVYMAASNFAVTTTMLNIITGSITVPPGFTSAVISLTGRVFAYNSTTAADYLYAKTYINGYCGYGLPLLCIANGGSNINVNSYAVVLTGLTAGGTIPISVNAMSSFANWAANTGNAADISGSILWFR